LIAGVDKTLIWEEAMAKAEIGLIGLGVMGSNLALNIAEKGNVVAVYNRTASRTGEFFEEAGSLREQFVPCTTLAELVSAIRPPRPIIIMTQAGKPVDEQIAALRPLVASGDIIIDAGNANFHDTMRRFQELEDTGIGYLGIGVSGGEEGARHGPSIMIGGPKTSYERVENVLTSIAARYKGEPCCAWLGPNGAGHFVKTIHNGIEYADMQMIAEVYGVLRDGLGMTAPEIGEIFARWNKGRLNSYLIEITATVLAATDPQTGRPVVDIIRDSAGQKGTGRWAVIEAQMLGVPATSIEAAVAARGLSSMLAERKAAEAIYKGGPQRIVDANKAQLIDDLEMALFASKIAAYAQGFAVMRAASVEMDWNLPMATIARIWRAGCIIRSQFLDLIATAFEKQPNLPNLLVAPGFAENMREAAPSLRRVASLGALSALPMPAMSSALAYVDSYTQSRGTANLIQAQRDFFGAHGFERLDAEGAFHGPWAGKV